MYVYMHICTCTRTYIAIAMHCNYTARTYIAEIGQARFHECMT